MISKIGLETTSNINNYYIGKERKNSTKTDPNFKGIGAIALAGMQACEKMPMVNVAVIDMLSAILPRTIIESLTNWFAGFEAFRRESSGLIVNCLIPNIITLGIAKLINDFIMPKGAKMSGCWADSPLINKAKDYYGDSNATDKVHDSLKSILGDINGFDRDKKVIFKNVLSPEDIEKYSKTLSELSKSKKSDKQISKEVKQIAQEIIQKTHVADNISISNNKSSIKSSSVKFALEDSVKFFKGYQQVKDKVSMEAFAKQSKKLVRAKSFLGLGVILPLAMSMQYINRWITSKISGVKGAPIYDDFGKDTNNIQNNDKSKDGLLKQKFISLSSMIGVSLLSMMKKPSIEMLEFKGMFPTMDQARIISTATFGSRMTAAEDKNELAESTVRDIATFLSLYFFGDYAAKGAATAIQKKTGVALLNDTKKLDSNASITKKLWHWVKDVNIKSTEEVIGATEKEIKRAKNLRSICQATNIGVSLLLLGIIIPIFTRKRTQKKHEADLKMQQNQQAVTPLNVKYSNLTMGFRSEKH